MNTDSKKSRSFNLIVSVMALFMSAVAANAGGIIPNIIVNLPATFARSRPAYGINVVSAPSDANALEVQVVDTETGQTVTNAHVKHWVWTDAKAPQEGGLSVITLDATGHGTYVCDQKHISAGGLVELRAHIPGESSDTWATVGINTWNTLPDGAASPEEWRQHPDTLRVNPWLSVGRPQPDAFIPAMGVWPGTGTPSAPPATRGFPRAPTNLVTGEPLIGY